MDLLIAQVRWDLFELLGVEPDLHKRRAVDRRLEELARDIRQDTLREVAGTKNRTNY
jgi:hypothetical protein